MPTLFPATWTGIKANSKFASSATLDQPIRLIGNGDSCVIVIHLLILLYMPQNQAFI